MTDKLEYIEQLSAERLRTMLDNFREIAKEAHQTLVVLIAGMGAAAANAITALQAGNYTAVPASSTVLVIYLSILSLILVRRCMMLEVIPSIGNEPDKLFKRLFELQHLSQPDYKPFDINEPEITVEKLREAQISSLQTRITYGTRIINRRANTLNVIRLLTAASPIIWFSSFCIWWY